MSSSTYGRPVLTLHCRVSTLGRAAKSEERTHLSSRKTFQMFYRQPRCEILSDMIQGWSIVEAYLTGDFRSLMEVPSRSHRPNFPRLTVPLAWRQGVSQQTKNLSPGAVMLLLDITPSKGGTRPRTQHMMRVRLRTPCH